MRKVGILAVVAVFAMAGALQAQTLQLDANAGAVYAGTNGPAQADGVAAGGTWNGFTGDVAAGGLAWDDGTTADGVSLAVNTTATGGEMNDGSLKNAMTEDYLKIVDFGNEAAAIEVTLSGLDAGLYDVYVIPGFNWKNNGPDDYYAYANAGANSADVTGAVVAHNYNATNLESWSTAVADANYGKISVTLEAGDDLVVWTRTFEDDGAGNPATDEAIFAQSLSGIQVYQVPEPATMSLLALGGIGVLLRRRRA